MRKLKYLSVLIISMMMTDAAIYAQSSFDPDQFQQFLDETRSMTAADILSQNPPKTTYYSHREFTAELSKIPWYDSVNNVFNLTAPEYDFLSNNYFMISERTRNIAWPDAFIEIYAMDLPIFISTDFILSTLHNSYDAILQTLEWQFLEPNLQALVDAMYAHYPDMYARYGSDDRFTDVLYDVDLYVAMAGSLLYNEEILPQKHDRALYDILRQGIADEVLLKAPLFTDGRLRKLDFSQFTPRGHYNKEIYPGADRTLENYFRAMMWLGRTDFLLTAPPENPWEPDWTEDELRRMQLGALLLNELLYECGKRDNLLKHEEIIEFLVGPDDNLTPDELKGLSEELLTSPADLFEKSKYDLFTEKLNASDDYGQKIMSNYFFVDPRSDEPGNLPVSFKLAGQKFLIDSYVFSEVVYDRIIVDGNKIYRGLPDPLDVMAALGNEDALALLEGELEKYQYAYKMASLKYLIESYDDPFWEQSLYNIWLGAIRDLNPPGVSDDLPFFMKTTAWHHEKLNTQLTSWAQLRHDNILYGKQSYTGGTGCSYPFTYVEPVPRMYERLESFASHAAQFFTDVLPDGSFDSRQMIIDYYSEYSNIMKSLKGIAEKELAGTAINDSEIEFLKTMINEYMASGPSITGWYNDLFFDHLKGMGWDFTVADVHTQPTDEWGNEIGRVLHVGNGFINMGVFIAPCPVNPDMLMTFCGPVSSFHTKETYNFERLTDQDWEELYMNSGEYPGRPDWIAEFALDQNGNYFKEGRSLKGIGYTGTGINPDAAVRDIDYLIAFPNPVQDELHLRFVLNRSKRIIVGVYDSSGRLITRPFNGELTPGEHDIPFNTSKFDPGLYLIEFNTGDRIMSKRVLVE